MSVILFASVVRARDGLPLSASTDHEQNMSVQETKKYLKVVSRKLEQLPDRCTMKRGPHTIKTVGAFTTLQIRLRHPQSKSPDYNV
ncbi:LOW QUALITY PROTEIN: vesicle-trafficking protein SEC22a [Mantella aurantiaca]